MNRNQQRGLAAIGGGIAAALTLTLIIPQIPTANANTPPKPPDPKECASKAHYFANDAPTGTNQFGPNFNPPGLKEAVERFYYKQCIDPAAQAVNEEFFAHGMNLDPNQVMTKTVKFISNRKAWRASVKSVNDQVEKFTLEDVPATYETLAMVPHGPLPPEVRKTERPVKLGRALVVHLKNGAKRLYRIICDLQPSVPHFKKVNPVPSQPATPPGQPPTPGITPPPGVTPTTRKPPLSFDCQQNGLGANCPEGVKRVRQHPQHNPCCYVGPTPGAGAEPPKPVFGAPPAEGKPPAQNGGGFNSGSGTGSGTPGDSQTNPDGTTTGGGPQPGSGPTVPVDTGNHTGGGGGFD